MRGLRRYAAGVLLCAMSPGAFAACTTRLAAGAGLQQAFNALPADGKPATLCLAAGEYRLQRLVAIRRDHLLLRGAGDATMLRMQDGVAQSLLVVVVGDELNEQPARTVRDVSIEKLRLVGAAAEHEFMPERPWLSNSGIIVRGGENIRLRALSLSACRSACILTERGSRQVTIDNNRVSGAVWDGVSFNRSAGIRLGNNDIRGNVAAGITAEHLEDSEIRGNIVSGNGSVGIYLSDSLRNRFVGNTVSDNLKAAIFLTCAVRFRKPQPVQCWDNSMSQGNVFERNELTLNPYGYTVGADDAANCAKPQWQANIWRDNRSDAPNLDPQPERFGRRTSGSGRRPSATSLTNR